MKLTRTLLTLAAVVTASLTLSTQAAPPAPANSGTVDVKTGQTVIKLDSSFFGALHANDVALKKITPGKIVVPKGELRFPIVAGTIDLANVTSEVISSGGVSFVKEDSVVTVNDFILTVPSVDAPTPTAVLSAVVVVNGVSLGRLDLFNFVADIAAPITLPKNKKIVFDNIELTLTQDGADALNEAFTGGTPVFTTSTVVGTATLSATTVKGSL